MGGVTAIVATAKHGGGYAGHNGLRLDVQEAAHLIGMPPPNEADAVRIDSATQQGHGATRTCGTCRNDARGEIGERRWKEANSTA
jgi:hypothetical protein